MAQKQRRRSWSPQEKIRLSAEALARRERGETWDEIGEALQVRPDSLRRWILRAQEDSEPALRPVTVVSAGSSRAGSTGTGLSVVTPDGFRIEGVDLETALRLWRSLR